MARRTRRAVLAAAASAAVSAVAGCTTPSEGDTTEEGSNGPGNGTGAEGLEGATPETPEEAAVQLVETLSEERFEAAHGGLEPRAGAEVSVGELEALWMGYTAVGGEFVGIEGTEGTVEVGLDAVDVTMAFERVEDVLRVYVDDLEVVGLVAHGEYERPSYVDPDTFEGREVTLESDAGPLSGTVTTPVDGEDVPGVVLVHGTGPANEDLETVATRAFEDLATGLATRGVATIRYDKRTYAHRVSPEEHTLEAVTIDDALLALEELRAVDAVDPDRIVVVGLSMGGMAAPEIARRDGDVAGAVALAAPARPLVDVVGDQLEHQVTVVDGEWTEVERLYERWPDQRARLRDGEYDLDEYVVEYPGAFWASLEGYDQVETAREVDVPLFFLQGDRDFQVTVGDDLERWRTELTDRPATDFTTYDGLNHLFMPGEGPSVPAEYAVRNNVDGRVVEDVAEWVLGL